MNTYDPRIEELFSTITDLSHVKNINREAFNDISKVILSLHDITLEPITKTVCDASMGHGKSTVLIAYLKWSTQQQIKIPLLIAVKEKQLAHEIYNSVHQVAPNAIINIDSDNKNLYEYDLYKYQIVIIQHQRLKNLALGFGELYDYSNCAASKNPSSDKKKQKRIKRKLIIDEMPEFVDSVIFDITSNNNVLDWFEDLAQPLKSLTPAKIQYLKSYIIMLLGEQLAENLTDHTTSLFTKEDVDSIRGKNLLTVLEDMKEHEENKTKYDSLNKLKHFTKLLLEDDYGRIDDYEYNSSGRKIIISKLIDYSILNMHLLVFDGTARANGLQYVTLRFEWAKIQNRNDYSRLHLHIEDINTSKYSRSKEGKPTQKTIAKRIRELKQKEKIFILPMKEEINTYILEYAISEGEKDLYYDDELNHTKGINLLNTTGKNFLKDYNSLYLACLPKRNADYYKCLGIAFRGHEITTLMTNSDSYNGNWFKDSKLETIYKHDLYSELLQIIHRTALRKIDEKKPIHIYIAYDEDKERYNEDGYKIDQISEFMKKYYLNDQAIIERHELTDMSLYGRDKKIEGFAKLIKEKLLQTNVNELSIGKINLSFNNYIKKHWESQKESIVYELESYGIKIYIDELDKRKTKKVKLL